MTVRVIGVTRPVIENLETSGQMLAYCARVSSTANQNNHATGPKLIASLIKREEWSPLEMVSATLEIVTTRDIARQILRHRSFAFQEFSQRYAVVNEPFVVREARDQHPTDRQSSTPTENESVSDWWERTQVAHARHVEETYQAALSLGIAKEQARAILPEGMTPSRLFISGTLRSWVHYIGLRSQAGTQKEHREVAVKCGEALRPYFQELEGVL